MRPIVKKRVGETVELFASIQSLPTERRAIEEDYRNYGDARKFLLANLGNYCSYCEEYFANGANLQIEHVQPKGLVINGIKPYAPLATKWSNFLLACSTCNGSGNKGQKDVILDEIHLPHRNNTFLSFIYKEAGVVEVNPNLSEVSRLHAEALMKLIGLDKGDTETDMRCDMRRQEWNKAQICRAEYESGKTSIDRLMDVILTSSCWSIWFTVFRGIDEVRREMIARFSGTDSSCFDQDNHYEPVYRNPKNLIDPV